MTRSPPATSYDDDFFAWTQEQADALRRLPTGAGDIDVAHVAEEIEDLGKRDLREVASFLTRLIEHLIKIDAAPGARDVRHWRHEARIFADLAMAAVSPSMRRLIDLDALWRRGRKLAGDDLADDRRPLEAPAVCPFTLADLLTKEFGLDRVLATLAAARPLRPEPPAA